MAGLHALDLGGARLGAGGDDDGVRFLRVDEFARHLLAGDDSHAGQSHLAAQICDNAAELGTAGQGLRQQGLAAQPFACLIEGHVMPALGGDGRGLHAARAAADHQDLPALHRLRQRAVGQLAPGLRMLDAGDRIAHMEMPDASLIARDAGADVVQPSALRLARHFRVADHRAGHADHVGLAGGDDLLAILRLVDCGRRRTPLP